MIRTILLAIFAVSVLCPLEANNKDRVPLVYIISIKKMIEPALLYVVRRGIDEAVRNEADAIIFEMDTPGGAVKAAEGIIAAITRTDIPTYTFVQNNAYSAGAIIALATPNIYMAPGSVIGAATPMIMSPMGGVQELPDQVEEKMTSAVAAMVRAAAERGGYDPKLAEAMVRADVEYTVSGKIISEKGRLLTLTNSEAEQRVGKENEPLLSKGTINDVDELLEKIGLSGAEKQILEATAAEKLARMIAAFAPYLMMLGLGGLWMEFRTPGFGIFGIAGILCLLLFFFGHHIAGLSGMEDVLLFSLGLLLLSVEIFIIPGFGIMGFSGLLLIFISFISAMSERIPGTWRPVDFSMETFSLPLLKVMSAFTGAVILAILTGRFLPCNKVFKSLLLDSVVSEAKEDEALVGLEGIAYSDLRPSGIALFGERKIDVITDGDYISHRKAVRIVEVHGNRIVVKDITCD